MEKKKTLTHVLGGVLIGGILLSGGMAFADDAADAVSGKAGKMPFFGQGGKHGGGMARGAFMGQKTVLSQENLNLLVQNGVISQAKADEIKAYIDEKKADNSKKSRGNGRGLMEELVTNKILTQEQADNIQKELKEIVQAQKQQQLADSLKVLVDKGTITQEQSDKILQKYEATEKERELFVQKMENMTLKEIRESIEDNKGKLQDPIQQLTTDGVITEDQANAIHDAQRQAAEKQQQQRLADGLKALVDKGTITQEQSDKILKKLEDAQKERKALFAKIKEMTPEERQQYMQDNKDKPQHPVSELVADGTITQKQADAIGQIVPGQRGFKGGRR